MKIFINFYLLILALAFLILEIVNFSQKMINKKRYKMFCYQSQKCLRLCYFGIIFKRWLFLKLIRLKILNYYVFFYRWLFLSPLFFNYDKITLFWIKNHLSTLKNTLSYYSFDLTFYHIKSNYRKILMG